ncbi:unnamed protein product [Trichobilharzia regenti]|nr:unnamed protein product [Trichobilharzia regenti]
MGLGKTIQSLAIAFAYYSEWPLLIIAPSSVRFSWRDQIIRWLGKALNLNLTHITVVNSGKDIVTDSNSFNPPPITIISYDLMSRYGKELLRRRYGVVIAVSNVLLFLRILIKKSTNSEENFPFSTIHFHEQLYSRNYNQQRNL